MNVQDRRVTVSFAAGVLLLVAMLSCGPSKKMALLQKESIQASLSLPKESEIPELEYRQARRDTLLVKDESGKDLIIMKAVRDDVTGEMVANEVLNPAMVVARFRNIAERRGKVDLQFQIIVPPAMQDEKWQTRYYPDMFILGDSIRLESIYMTGEKYRKAQLKGYQQYERFLSRIITDTTKFIDINQLEIFLRRNIPGVYAFKTDSTEVSDEIFYSYFGVTEQQAVEHYTSKLMRQRNKRLIAKRRKMYEKYVKAPIVTDGIRLDTIIRGENGEFIYNYTQTINTRPKLRKVDIVLSGDIYEQDKRLYSMPRSEPLTFYISSISSFANQDERYLTRVISRRAEANASYRIEFALGKSDVRTDLSDNAGQIAHVKENLTDLLRNEIFDLDSIVVVANASPEGSFATNGALSRKRSDAVVGYFEKFMSEYRRDAQEAAGYSVDEDGNMTRNKVDIPNIKFRSYSVPENWRLLDILVGEDFHMNEAQKERYFSHASVKDADRREAAMKADDYYKYMRDSLYPRLRVVDFSFVLHRKGMIKDTVHTTELDERYMEGVRLLKDMDYEKAVEILGPYQDYNAAVAYMGAERNASAMLILQNLERTAQVNYLLSILHSRNGNERDAVQCYLNACNQDHSYVHRGNLDPEISVLIKLYGLNRQPEDDDLLL